MTRLVTLWAILALAAPAAADSHRSAERAPAGEATERGAPGAEGAEAAPEPAPEAGEPAAAADSGAPTGPAPEVARAQFTTAVEGREPVDRLETLDTDVRKLFFFSELRGFQGRRVVHRWSYEGEVRAEVPFEVKGPRWRVYSSKELRPDWTGEWTVAVVDERGDVVTEERFVYRKAESPAGAARGEGAATGSARGSPAESAGDAPTPAPEPEPEPELEPEPKRP